MMITRNTNYRIMTLMCLGLVVAAVVFRVIYPFKAPLSGLSQTLWNGFLFGLPLGLAGFLLMGARWALMAGIMYGTVGLALDVSTIVQELTQPDEQASLVAISSLTGLLNFALIVFGGRGLLQVE